jgi:hypothetical protein
MKTFITNLLSFIFPFEDISGYRSSVFIQQTWLDKIMTSTQVKDYLWTPPYQEK